MNRLVSIEIDAKGFKPIDQEELHAQALNFAEHIGLSSATVDCLDRNHVTIYYDGIYINNFDSWYPNVVEQWAWIVEKVTGNKEYIHTNWSSREDYFPLGEFSFMSPEHEHTMNVFLNFESGGEISIEEDYFEASINIKDEEISTFLSDNIQTLKQSASDLIQKTWPNLEFKKFEYTGTVYPYCEGVIAPRFEYNRITPEKKRNSLINKLLSLLK
jgi:hypothetical protein